MTTTLTYGRKEMKHTHPLEIAPWDVPDMNVLEFPKNESHFTFFKSACKDHLFSMTKTGKIFEVVFIKAKKKDKFKLVRVL